MAKYQYQISGTSKWMSSSGNALLALYNYSGSTKKINIHSVEIYNNTRFGPSNASNTNAPAPTKIKVGPVTGLSGGSSLTPEKHDSGAGSWPSTVSVLANPSYSPVLVQRGSTLTMAGATAGSTTFTPGTTPSPAWTTNEHRQASRYFFVGSGGNAGTYRILSNTATALTLTHPLSTTVSTDGYVADSKMYAWLPIVKTLNTSTTSSLAFTNTGTFCNRNISTGDIFRASPNSATQKLTVAANEQLAVFADFPAANIPVFVSVTLVRNGTPNYTYTVCFYTYLMAEYTALFGINNASGSGETIQIESISVSEVGTQDTPYFQLVPISKVNAVTLSDSTRKMTSDAFAVDSTSPSLSGICDIFTDAQVAASGIPISYISEGSANAIPKGFNYLNTKDFVGPTFASFFPESAAFKIPDSTFWSTSTPGTFGAQISQDWSSIKGRLAPIVIREGEGIALVSGAETAAGASVNSVGASGWTGIDFAITFSVENASTPQLVLTGLQVNSEILILNSSTQAQLASQDLNLTGTFSYSYDYTPGVNVDIIVHSLGYEYYRLTNIPLTSTGVSIPISQRLDRNYVNP